jgi:hypothetical protein
MAEKKKEVAVEVEIMQKPKYPITAMDTGQKVKVDEGYRYMIMPDGSVKKTPLPPKMTEKEKAAVKAYMSEKNKWKRQRMQKSLNYASRRGAKAAKMANKSVLKEANVQLREAKKVGKIEAKKVKLQLRIEALQKKAAKIK